MAATLPSWCTWYPASPLDSRVKTYPARALSIPGAGANFNALGSQEGANGWLVDRIVDNEIHI
ncbi:MAG TPA: hypothetical protein VK604_25010 [Bryobacteraceae bacterium]|nr:hypothetical protein [Bryobacteraceae bacterium]